jgi:hypothetical protein
VVLEEFTLPAFHHFRLTGESRYPSLQVLRVETVELSIALDALTIGGWIADQARNDGLLVFD